MFLNILIYTDIKTQIIYTDTHKHVLTFASLAIRLQSETDWTAAADSSGRVFTCAITSTIVYCTGLWVNMHTYTHTYI